MTDAEIFDREMKQLGGRLDRRRVAGTPLSRCTQRLSKRQTE